MKYFILALVAVAMSSLFLDNDKLTGLEEKLASRVPGVAPSLVKDAHASTDVVSSHILIDKSVSGIDENRSCDNTLTEIGDSDLDIGSDSLCDIGNK